MLPESFLPTSNEDPLPSFASKTLRAVKDFADHNTWMRLAVDISKRSYAEKRKVGCVLVQDGAPVSTGWNGTPPGFPNTCEDWNDQHGMYLTRPTVLHAELNCLGKLLRKSISSVDGDLYVTYSPCVQCSLLISLAKPKSVWYLEPNRDPSGLNILSALGISVNHYETRLHNLRHEFQNAESLIGPLPEVLEKLDSYKVI